MRLLYRLLPLVAIGALLAVGCTTDTNVESDGSLSTSSPAPTTTAPAPSTSVASPATPTTSPAPPTTMAPAPETTVEQSQPVDPLADFLAGHDWEFSGIERNCLGDAALWGARCTGVVHDTGGVPISYDPVTRTLTRHTRESDDLVQAVLPASYGEDVWLLMAGPDNVVYLNVVVEPEAEGSADVVAVALAPGDVGREIERFVGWGNPGVDFDFVSVPQGIVTTDWYGQGQRPASDRLVGVPWADRDPADDDWPKPGVDRHPNGVPSITIDAYERTVTVDGRTWVISGPAAEFPPTGMPPIAATFDGGFIARYDQVANDYNSIVVRGWPDESVDEFVVPGGPEGFGWTIVPEPAGTVLVPNGNVFVRIAPFEARPQSWPGPIGIDTETGEASVAELNEYLGSRDADGLRAPWSIGPVAFANAVVGPVPSLATLRTVTHLSRDGDVSVVQVTDENLLDGSVYAERFTMTINMATLRVEQITWSNSCQPGRGHQDFQATLCL